MIFSKLSQISNNNFDITCYLCQISLQIMLLPIRIQSFRVEVANFSRLYCLTIPRRDLPESLGVTLEFNISNVGYLITQSDPEASACEESTLWFCCFPIGPESDTISSANHKAKLKQSTIQNFYMILQQWCRTGSSSLCNAYRNILAIIRNNFYDFRLDPV